jgi:hypothetical protein
VTAKDGKAEVTATFRTVGDYVLRARATDGDLTAHALVSVRVE